MGIIMGKDKEITEKGLGAVIAFAIIGIIMAIPLALILMILLLLLDGFIFSQIWKWWIVPTFGANPLTLVQAMAISVLIAYFRNQHYLSSEIGTKNKAKTFLNGIIVDLLYFGVAWLLLFFK